MLKLFRKFNQKKFSQKFDFSIKSFNYHTQSAYNFERYHVPFTQEDIDQMLKQVNCNSIEEFRNNVISDNLRSNEQTSLVHEPISIDEAKQKFEELINKNKNYKTYIGEGFYDTKVPSLIKRCILENPGWYTAYTPYQAEIAQGRLEALFNYQILIKRLTQMDFANASLLDEASAAGEAVFMAHRICKKKRNTVLVSNGIFRSSLEVIKSYCSNVNIKVVETVITHDVIQSYKDDVFAVVLQSPDNKGVLHDFTNISTSIKELDAMVIVGTDLMSQVISKPIGQMNVDIVYGNAQRFGVPMGFGGPHAAFFACRLQHIRSSPGRLIGLTQDKHGNPAYRISLTTREQHIKKERATSNICTAQVLLANMNFFYALYHGEEGIINIAQRINYLTQMFVHLLQQNSIEVLHDGVNYFDTVCIKVNNRDTVIQNLLQNEINCYKDDQSMLRFSFDETKTIQDVLQLVSIITDKQIYLPQNFEPENLSDNLTRKVELFKDTDVFKQMKGEQEVTRFIRRLEMKDVTLCNSMIPLGSCTMKLNSAYQLDYLADKKMNLHPFVPIDQSQGYHEFIEQLSQHLLNLTQMYAVSYQSNSGATGEYLGLMAIKLYHENNNNQHKQIILIPSSAHGTNFASCSKIGLKPLTIQTQKNGYIDLQDLKSKCEKYGDNIAGMMITYPSTFGTFEEYTLDAVNLVRDQGGLIYIDGANMNAHFCLTSPGKVGDVCHLNLHKSFCIPHGGGGPGHGPVLCNEKLAPFLPTHYSSQNQAVSKTGYYQTRGQQICNSIFTSASILSISYLYVLASGTSTMRRCTDQANLNANYLQSLLKKHYKVYFTNEKGYNAHEFILDMQQIRKETGVTEEDICKRLMDYGFHAPTQSFPLPRTLMIEPTESENKDELDRFAQALIQIKQEIDLIKDGVYDKQDNPLKNAPHTQEHLMKTEWNHCYSREIAGYPLDYIRQRGKVWPAVGRIDGVQGDRNLKIDYDQQQILYTNFIQVFSKIYKKYLSLIIQILIKNLFLNIYNLFLYIFNINLNFNILHIIYLLLQIIFNLLMYDLLIKMYLLYNKINHMLCQIIQNQIVYYILILLYILLMMLGKNLLIILNQKSINLLYQFLYNDINLHKLKNILEKIKK